MTNAAYILDNAENSPEEVKDLLIEMHERGETTAEIVDFVQELEKRKVKVSLPNDRDWKVFDVCGTGGSGKSRINLSTPLAMRLSKKFTIAKHGNKAASGKVGSFDLIEKVNLEISDTPEKVVKNLMEHNLAFIFAPMFHPALKHFAPIRAQIPHPTIFNMLGPLLNPVENLTAQLTGVSSVAVLEKLAPVAAALGKNILFVHDTAFGLDDVSIGGETAFAKVKDGKVEFGTFTPEDYGLTRVADFAEIAGGRLETNSEIFENLVNGTAPEAHKNFLKINELVATEFFNEFV